MNWQDLITKLWGAIVAFGAFLAGQADARKTQELKDVKDTLETRERVDRAPTAERMPDDELHAYLERKGRLRP